LRSTRSSNLVGCSTGKSAGLTPEPAMAPRLTTPA
jgi:hypothetical protein